MLESEIEKAAQRLTFTRMLPEFIDRAKYLEGKLQEGERLEVEMTEVEIGRAKTNMDVLILKLYGREDEPIRAVSLSGLGISYFDYLFTDYRPLPDSQRYPNN